MKEQRRKFRFKCTSIDLSNLVEIRTLKEIIKNSKEIKYDALLRNVDVSDLRSLFPSHATDARKGITLKKDRHVHFYVSCFFDRENHKEIRVYYVFYKEIRYVFY